MNEHSDCKLSSSDKPTVSQRKPFISFVEKEGSECAIFISLEMIVGIIIIWTSEAIQSDPTPIASTCIALSALRTKEFPDSQDMAILAS